MSIFNLTCLSVLCVCVSEKDILDLKKISQRKIMRATRGKCVDWLI